MKIILQKKVYLTNGTCDFFSLFHKFFSILFFILHFRSRMKDLFQLNYFFAYLLDFSARPICFKIIFARLAIFFKVIFISEDSFKTSWLANQFTRYLKEVQKNRDKRD